jgi:hypothetical protein
MSAPASATGHGSLILQPPRFGVPDDAALPPALRCRAETYPTPGGDAAANALRLRPGAGDAPSASASVSAALPCQLW